MSDNSPRLSAGEALVDPKDDRLGFSPFAKTLANSIRTMLPPEGMVVAIYGTWGSGKTTMLNFVVNYLEQTKDHEIIVHFNPWWFSSQEDLTRRFFEQIQAVLRQSEIRGELLDAIAAFSDAISEVPLPYTYLAKHVASFIRWRRTPGDIVQLKVKIAELLRAQSSRILIVIDDIDRLTADEARQVFRLIKAVADFPGVVYLVAFDKKIAAKALANVQADMPGEAYLEKIVQIPFELPTADRSSIQTILFQQLQGISAGTPRELFDETEWGIVYLEGLEHFIRTPRDIVRLTNTVSVTYPAVKGEVNFVDFLAIETIRVFCPYVYDIIRNNSGAFTGQTDGGLLVYPLAPTVEGLRTFHNDWMSKVEAPDKDAITRLLKRIFPKTKSVWENTHFDADWLSQWRKSRRICSPEVFPIYFRLAIPSGDISNAEMAAILAVTNDSVKFGATLVELSRQLRPDGTSKVRVALDRINDYTDVEIQPTSINPIIKALFNVGDELLVAADRSVGVLSVDNDIRISRIVYRLLRRLNENDRFALLRESISDGHATSTIVHEVSIFGQEHGKYGGSLPSSQIETTVNQDHLAQLELKALQKIRDSAKEDTLLQAPSFLGIIYRWRDWAGDAEVKKWVRAVVETREGLVHFLEKFLVWSFSQPMSDPIGTTSYKLDVGITLFVDPSQIIEQVRSRVNDSSLSNREKLAIQLFLSEYSKK